jgi:hypothetical protein
MNIKIIALFANILIGAGVLYYVVDLIQTNAEQKKELTTVKNNLERLEAIQRAERRALELRENKYNEAQFKHTQELEKLQKALNDAKSIDNCVDRYIPDDVVKQLRGDRSADQMPATK